MHHTHTQLYSHIYNTHTHTYTHNSHIYNTYTTYILHTTHNTHNTHTNTLLLYPYAVAAEPARLGSAQDVQVSPRDAFGVRSGWRAGPRGWLAPWAPRRFLRRFPFPKIAYPAYKSGRDGSPPTPPKVKLVYV
ncbi:unnamed protein product, partial [Musa textilis]